MKTWIHLLLWSTLALSLTATGTTQLSPLPNNPADVVFDSDKNRLSCAEVIPALREYNDLARANETAFADFVVEVTNVMYGWHDTLSPLEGQNKTIEAGTFSPIVEGADQIDAVVGLVYENSDQLAERMEKILSALNRCM